MAILDQAFLRDSQAQANYAVMHEIGALIQKKAEPHGIKVIGYLESGFRDVFSKRPVEKMADFNGLKIRTMQNQGQLQAFTSFGANPIALAAGEQFTALQQGTIDACENAVSNCWINKFYEAGVNSVINTKHCFVYIPICISNNAWKRIELLKGVGVKFYDIGINELKAAYAEKQNDNGTSYAPEFVIGLNLNSTLFCLVIAVILLIFGTFMEGTAIAVLLVPVLWPMAKTMGIHPIHFGMIVCISNVIGTMTPPVAVNIFSAVQVTRSVRELKIGNIAKAEMPYFIGYTAVFFLCVFSEWFCTFLIK